MVVLEKRETRQISFFVRGLKAGGPADSSNLVNERVNYDEVISVDFASTPQGFQISVLTDRIEVKFFVHEDWSGLTCNWSWMVISENSTGTFGRFCDLVNKPLQKLLLSELQWIDKRCQTLSGC
jgi:hypothetical protein